MINREKELLLKLNINWDVQSKEFIQMANYFINGIEIPQKLLSQNIDILKKESKKHNICMMCGENLKKGYVDNKCPMCKN